MTRKNKRLLPKHERLLETLGENLKLDRLRRRLSAAKVAERAGISRGTLSALENGNGGWSISTLLMVLVVLGLEQDLRLLAQDDVLGRKLADAELISPRKRVPRKSTPSDQS